MRNLAPLLPAAEQFSRRYRGRGELIDHILVSHHLVNRVVAIHTVTATPQLPSITDNPAEARGIPGSDHAALTATFDLSR